MEIKIKDLQPKQGKVDLQATLVSKPEPREFEKFGKKGKVCNASIRDDTGDVKLTLWNEQVDQVNEGDIVKITNGYVSEFRGDMQLSTGKFGTLEVLDKTTEDHGEHILTQEEKEESEALNEEMKSPSPEEEVTEDEMEESELYPDKSDGVDVDEEKVI